MIGDNTLLPVATSFSVRESAFQIDFWVHSSKEESEAHWEITVLSGGMVGGENEYNCYFYSSLNGNCSFTTDG